MRPHSGVLTAMRWCLLLVVAALLAAPANAESPAAATQPATQGKGKLAGGSLIWAVGARPVGGKAVATHLYAVAVNSNAVYAAGIGREAGIVEKLNPADGSTMWKSPIATGTKEAMHIALDAEFMYVPGNPWMLEKRKLSDGALVWQVKGQGKPYTVKVDATGVYMGGKEWQIEKRSLADGSILWHKNGPSGVVLSAALDSTGVYFGGYDETPGDKQWRVEKRNLRDGSLIWEQTLNPSNGADQVYGVAVDSTGLYAAGYDSAAGGGRSRIEKRRLTDGKLMWEVNNDPTPGLDKAHGLCIDATGLYIPGYQGGSQWRIEKRSLADGSIIWQVLSVRGGRMWYAAAVDDNGVYVGGYAGGQWRIEKRAK